MRRQALSRRRVAGAAALAAASLAGVLDVRAAGRHARQRADAEDPRRPQGRGRAGRTASRPTRRRRSTPTASSSTIAPRAPQRAEAMRRLGDLEMDSADNQQRRPARPSDARLQGGDRALPGLPEDLSERPGQRPRALPARARPRAGRRPRDGAEDARPAGAGLPAQPLTATRRSSAAASCCSRHATTRRPRRPSPPCSQAARPTPYHDRALYMHGWSLFKQGRLEDALHSFFGVLDLKIAGREGEGDLDDARRPDARRPRAGRGHLPRHQHQPGQPAGRRVDPALHRRRDERRELRVPRLRAARRALHQAGAHQGRGRHLRRVRAAASRCMRRRRCCRRA